MSIYQMERGGREGVEREGGREGGIFWETAKLKLKAEVQSGIVGSVKIGLPFILTPQLCG